MRRFQQEAQAAAALNHPNILAVYQLGNFEGATYLVSELLEGGTLRQGIERGALPVRKAIDYGVQIAHGLAAAHHKGIVHRDLKPENIFITRDGRQDPGFWSCESDAAPTEIGRRSRRRTNKPGQVMGTAGYMAPEQVRGETVDHRADIFAFGAILYELVTRQRAFKKPTSAETMTAILHEDPPAISQLPQDDFTGAVANRAAVSGEKARAAISIGIGSGVRAGGVVGLHSFDARCG